MFTKKIFVISVISKSISCAGGEERYWDSRNIELCSTFCVPTVLYTFRNRLQNYIVLGVCLLYY